MSVNADRGNAQRLLPGARDNALHVVGGFGAARATRRIARFGGGSLSSDLRSILPLLVSGSSAKKDERGRNHVVGQLGVESGAQGGCSLSVRGLSNQIGNQPLVAFAVFAENDNGLADAGRFFEQRLDLARLDAMAAQFDLVVGAAQEIDIAVRQETCQIAGAVQALIAEGRNRNEALSGQLGPLPVAARHAVAADEELADLARRNGIERGIER